MLQGTLIKQKDPRRSWGVEHKSFALFFFFWFPLDPVHSLMGVGELEIRQEAWPG